MRRLELFVGLLIVTLCSTALAEPTKESVASGSEVSFVAKITGGSFVAKTEKVSGSLAVDREQKRISGTIVVQAGSFSSGLGMRDNHMRDKYLEAEKFETLVFTAADQPFDPEEGKPSKVQGTLTVKGMSQPVTVDVKLDAGTANATFQVDVTKFGIPQPSFAVVKMDPIVEATVKLVLKHE
ncbi:YceI family protein [Vulgatibacter incomptus]|uniref:Lipid/polyisoprenoid-binding YceI-like domain-containing protein n=1 Tax=Vulgatibacter incomptus TaxID=1391653 RepID=A0A0K1PI11_9BACT|nr:YceI family protein [Vulgatibacter incomptus]AKU93165.1 hypothetical protein AKJ08_3552 [Vulgatibacter incomptus]